MTILEIIQQQFADTLGTGIGCNKKSRNISITYPNKALDSPFIIHVHLCLG